ncbi:MAG: two pore domain potassium channel family protein, partial [Clostridia bacterium]|nr:two pore domain potassium channel family protein [Clostridia bacterium]
CIGGLLIALFEPTVSRFLDGLWYCFIASTTVGFGDFVATTLLGRIVTVIVVFYGIVAATTVPGVVLTYYLEYIKVREKETVSLFLEKLENLPSLSKEELEQLSQKIRKMKK